MALRFSVYLDAECLRELWIAGSSGREACEEA